MQPRKLGLLSVLILSLSLISGSLYANEKKPTKEIPSAAANNSNNTNGSGSSNKNNSDSGSNKIQEPVPAPTPTAQPVEAVSTTTVVVTEYSANNSANSKPENSNKSDTTGKPNDGNSSQPNSKPEPNNQPGAESQAGTPGSTNASASSTTQGGNSNANPNSNKSTEIKNLNTAASSRTAVVKASSFKSTKLVPGRLAANKVNAAAKALEKKSADEECGVEEKTANSKASSKVESQGKSSSAAGKKSSAAATNENAAASKPKEECKDYILVFSDDSVSGDIDAAAKEAKGKVLQKFNNVFKGALVNGPPSKIEALAKNPKIQSIELDGTVTKQDLYSNPVWGLDRIDQRNLPLSSSYDDLNNSGYTIPVYVVDTGIYAEHSEFTGRVAARATSITDGYGTFDCNGHGTHVAGTIAGTKFGIAKGATLIPVRVLDCAGSGSYSGVISGLDWIAANHPAGVPAVVNMSLGGPASSSLDGAVNNLISRGITVVVAAGNSGADACNYSPARVTAAITVAATGIDDARANYSNYGSCVDVFAPGSSITSAWISGVTGSAVLSGTSMAAPHVAGSITRFLYTNPTSTPYQSANSLTKSATLDLVTNAGPGTANRLLFFDIAFDSTTAPISSPTTTKPSNPKKTTNPGKGNKG